ncbi:MAG: hypothetical protein FWC91_09070 [Defluviitaleaceae bacterium]|nr:hypothetical protein [Defluviitaleaceae bacterium]
MSKQKKHDPIVYMMEKVAHHSMLLEKNPQCGDCEHMQFVSFNYDIHLNVTRKIYCSQCIKFKRKAGNDNDS